MIRTFIAVPLPEFVISSIRELQDNIKEHRLKLKWVKPENIHLTLKFLGNIYDSDIDKIAKIMENTACDYSPIKLQAKALGVFPGIKKPRIMWAGLKGDTHKLIQLQKQLDAGLEKLGFARAKRSFKAHLTIARIKGYIDPVKIADIIKECSKFESQLFTGHEIILYQSILKPAGAVYTKLRTLNIK